MPTLELILAFKKQNSAIIKKKQTTKHIKLSPNIITLN